MPDQQATAGASMHDEQVTNKHPDHQDAPATDQQASDYTTTYQAVCCISSSRATSFFQKNLTDRLQQTHDSTSSLDNHDEDFLNDPVTTYTLMLDHFSKGNIEEGEKLAQELVLWGPYPEKVHARLVSVISLSQPNTLFVLSKCTIDSGYRNRSIKSRQGFDP